MGRTQGDAPTVGRGGSLLIDELLAVLEDYALVSLCNLLTGEVVHRSIDVEFFLHCDAVDGSCCAVLSNVEAEALGRCCCSYRLECGTSTLDVGLVVASLEELVGRVDEVVANRNGCCCVSTYEVEALGCLCRSSVLNLDTGEGVTVGFVLCAVDEYRSVGSDSCCLLEVQSVCSVSTCCCAGVSGNLCVSTECCCNLVGCEVERQNECVPCVVIECALEGNVNVLACCNCSLCGVLVEGESSGSTWIVFNIYALNVKGF